MTKKELAKKLAADLAAKQPQLDLTPSKVDKSAKIAVDNKTVDNKTVDSKKTDNKKKNVNKKAEKNDVAPKVDKSEKPADEPAKQEVKKKFTSNKKKPADTSEPTAKQPAEKPAKQVATEKPATEPKKPVKPSEPAVNLREIYFPKTFTVHGVKFTRVELQPTTFTNEKNKQVTTFLDSFCDTYDDADEKNLALCVGLRWTDEELSNRGKNMNLKSKYFKSTGCEPPEKFPAELDMMNVDIILQFRTELVSTHSYYTEFCAVIPFETFDKRTKDGFFMCNVTPCEVYIADFSKADKSVQGSFINLYTK